MVQEVAVEIISVPLPFYDAYDGLSDVFLDAGGLGIQLAPLFDHGDLLLDLGDFPVAALIHKPEI